MAPLYTSQGFEVGNALDRGTFPAARLKRTGPPASGGDASGTPPTPGLPAPPQSFVFPFVLLAPANSRSSISSPKLRGPSIVRGLHMAKGGNAEGVQGIALGKSLSPVLESAVAIATPRPYTSLFTGLPAVNTAEGAPNDAASLIDMQTTILSDADDLGIIVLDRDWFLVITAATAAAAAADTIHGYVTVLDQVSSDILALYGG